MGGRWHLRATGHRRRRAEDERAERRARVERVRVAGDRRGEHGEELAAGREPQRDAERGLEERALRLPARARAPDEGAR